MNSSDRENRKNIGDKFLLNCFYHLGSLTLVFPWDPKNGKIFYQLIITISFFLALCIAAYLLVKKYTGNDKDVIILVALDSLAYILLHLISIYDLVKKRKILKTLYVLLDNLDQIMNISNLYTSKNKIFWHLAIWLFYCILFIILTSLKYLSNRTFLEAFIAFYLSMVLMHLSAAVGYLLEISIVLKKRVEIFCELTNLLTLCKNPYRRKYEVIHRIRMLKSVYEHFSSIISKLNSIFGKKLLIFIILMFIAILDTVNYILYLHYDAQFQVAVQEFLALLILMVSFYKLEIL